VTHRALALSAVLAAACSDTIDPPDDPVPPIGAALNIASTTWTLPINRQVRFTAWTGSSAQPAVTCTGGEEGTGEGAAGGAENGGSVYARGCVFRSIVNAQIGPS
jgi:hypothetical protein